MELDLFEVFTSFQGEGILLGKAQVFLRLAGCDLDCLYCDTRGAGEVPPVARLETGTFEGSFRELPNPVRVEDLVPELLRLRAPGVVSLSVTGGEPLLQAEGLAALLEKTRGRFDHHYLETNGTLPEAMGGLADLVDTVAMDVKLSSVTGQESRLAAHAAFLSRCRPGQAFLKMVLCEGVDLQEVEEAVIELAAMGRARVLVLQPVSAGYGAAPPSFRTLADAFSIAVGYFQEVRVIPQAHRAMEVP